MRQSIQQPIGRPPQPPDRPPSRSTIWRQRAQRWRAQSRSVLLVGGGMVIALATLFVYDALKPAPPRITQRAIDAAVARAMASATPPPPIAARVYALIQPSLVQVRTRVLKTDGKSEGSLGTGVVLDDSGAILTSLHVVKDAIEIRVIFYDGSESEASVVVTQPENDIALLRPREIPDNLMPAVLGNPNSVQVGDEAIVVGNPFGITDSLSAGVISGLHRNFKSPKTGSTLTNLIQFDAAVNPGNSGGPLLNRDGEVVGIVTALLNPTDQDVFIGIGFAVTIDTAAAAAGSPPY